ncbi:pyridoxamine 5'-phosphate oxidase family protein [Halalkalibacter sp. APA_J-10(15)]|uniref:pyridoxamine 5'-phosphate oxidase family protein n=1 Tax=Halalkalibacter sp. APA_J-10(15) TaxID=2933805 RepID=UPI001FF3C7F5|nr:pyridoxamine 5'-phosphate oxidase family protein [Halalkalibacter sp. APA_J-10(15)]MCK0473730.1 pyridoxamine 5'-phosphate oxidase family protein [Halalkalibacter sp. APA_J-10(15)]
MEIFHSGERKVQSKIGVINKANLVGQMIQPFIDESYQFFIESQSVIIIGSTDAKGGLWSSLICGDRGFIRVINNRTIKIHMMEKSNDVLLTNLKSNLNVGMIVIEFSTRIRIRINGVATILDEETIEVKTEQIYGNCPKYIQSRHIKLNNINETKKLETLHSMNLNKYQRSWIERSDTFFISSSNSLGKTDVSHRGGQAGFIRVIDETTLIYPDYVGNMMFNTLGNMIENAKTGLLFTNFQEGHTLQLTGSSKIIWNLTEDEKLKYPGAKRLIEYVITGVIEKKHALKYQWDFLEYSPYNPK